MPSACILAAVFGPTPWNFAIGSVRHEGLSFVRQDRELAVWLAIVRCDLDEKFVAGNSGRGCEPDFVVDASPDFLGGLPRGRDAFEFVAYCEGGLIERERLDQRGVVPENRLNLFGHFAVNVEPRRD